ncbi:MAG: GNAT family N-acetyltransferase [Acidobacteriota bacterium]|nr:GNAT family N-acetyltransferase [Acidobacteriota bacterium]
MSDVSIRRARPDDSEVLGRLGASLMRAHYAFDERRFLAPGAHAESGYAAFLETQLTSADSLVLVAERTTGAQPAAVIGYVYAGIEPLSWKELRGEAGFIHDLLVSDEARALGVGQRLMEAAVAWLKERGAPRVMLWAAAPNSGAQRLFERNGFRPTMIEMTRELE